MHELTRHGHSVLVQAGAGLGSFISDEEYAAAGGTVVADHEAVWGESELILKVKEPIAEEYDRMQPGQTLFTYLHLAASRDCTARAAGAPGHRHRVRDRPDRRAARCPCWPR